MPNINTGNELMDKALTDILLILLGYVAENERAYIRERQSVGIEIAKKEGRLKVNRKSIVLIQKTGTVDKCIT